jgi:acyl carrier protein
MANARALFDGDTSMSRDAAADTVLRQVLQDVLGLSAERVAGFTPDTGLFGHLPELDSMAVAGLLTEVEDRLGIVIEDDEVDGEMLETYGALLDFVEVKRSA